MEWRGGDGGGGGGGGREDVKDETLRMAEGERAWGLPVTLSEKLSDHRCSNLRHFQLSVSPRESHPRPTPHPKPPRPTACKQKMLWRPAPPERGRL